MDCEQLFSELITIINYANKLGDIADTTSTIISAVLAIGSLIVCFFGYKIIKLMISVTGCLIGFLVSIPFIGMILNILSIQFDNSMFLISILFSICGGLLAFKIYKVGIFFVSGFLPFIFILMLNSIFNDATLIIAISMYIVFGIIGALLTKPYIILVTSIGYGVLSGINILSTFKVSNIGASILVGTVLAFLGAVYQFKVTQNIEDKNKSTDIKAKISIDKRLVAITSILATIMVVMCNIAVIGVKYNGVLTLLAIAGVLLINTIIHKNSIKYVSDIINYRQYIVTYTIEFLLLSLFIFKPNIFILTYIVVFITSSYLYKKFRLDRYKIIYIVGVSILETMIIFIYIRYIMMAAFTL